MVARPPEVTVGQQCRPRRKSRVGGCAARREWCIVRVCWQATTVVGVMDATTSTYSEVGAITCGAQCTTQTKKGISTPPNYDTCRDLANNNNWNKQHDGCCCCSSCNTNTTHRHALACLQTQHITHGEGEGTGPVNNTYVAAGNGSTVHTGRTDTNHVRPNTVRQAVGSGPRWLTPDSHKRCNH